MVQTADFGNLQDPARFGELDGSDVGGILIEREVRSSLVIVGEVPDQDATQVSFAKNENMIQTFAPDRTDEPLREGVLPWTERRGQHFTDSHALNALPKWVTVDAIAIAEEIGRRGVVREGVDELLGGPDGGGMLGDVEMEDASAVVGEHDEDEEDAEPSGGHGEKIDRDQVPDVISQERSPSLRWRRAPLRDQARDGALGHIEAKLEELAMDSWSAPERVRDGHAGDQGLDLGVDSRSTPGRPGGELGPVGAEAAPLPPQDGVRGHDQEGLPPSGPDSGQPDPEEAISSA